MSNSKEQEMLARLEGENAEEKIEVVATDQSPATLEIRSLRWGRGIGWYVQKTITLDAMQAKTLMNELRGSVVMSARKTGKGKVIPFPVAVPR